MGKKMKGNVTNRYASLDVILLVGYSIQYFSPTGLTLKGKRKKTNNGDNKQ